MATTCHVCKRSYTQEDCPYCTATDIKASQVLSADKLHLSAKDDANIQPTAFLVDLVSNRKIPITTPRCKVGRDDLNDIVISGDQSISRFHFVITQENDQYFVQDSKSRHGTFLNGNQISGPLAINDGDVLKVGVSLFWFVIENQTLASTEQFAPVDIESIQATELRTSDTGSSESLKGTSDVDVETMPALQDALAAAGAKLEAKAQASAPQMKVEPAVKDEPESKEEPGGKGEPESKEEPAGKGEPESKEEPAGKGEPESKEEPGVKGEHESKEEPGVKGEPESKEEPGVKGEPESKEEPGVKGEPESKEEPGGKGEPESKEEPGGKGEPESNEEPGEGSDTSEKKRPASRKGRGGEGPQITASMLLEALELEALNMSGGDRDDAEPGQDSEKVEDKGTSDQAVDADAEPSQPRSSRGNGKNDESPVISKEVKEMTEDMLDDILPVVKPKDLLANARSNEDKISEPDLVTSAKAENAQSDSQSGTRSTLDKLADAVEGAAEKESKGKEGEKQPVSFDSEDFSPERDDKDIQKPLSDSDEIETQKVGDSLIGKKQEEITTNGATSGMSNTAESTLTKVPDWCTKYFASELNQLNRELDQLNEQVKAAQQKIKEVENRVVATKTLRNTLLTATGEDLVEACGKVLARLGWKVKIVDDDKQELRLESDDKVAICRIIWTEGLPERSHLGQLSIAQTRFWCEQGAEPKGILIAAQAEEKAPPKLTKDDYEGELADYAGKKNVCLMTTLQLLAMYKEIALNEGSSETLRTAIHSTSGWLSGYSLEPSDEDETESNKVSSLLSA